MIQRLKYWIFQRGKHCRRCCLFCEYYDLCRNEVTHECRTIKARLPDGKEITIQTIPSWDRKVQRMVLKRAQKERREHEKL